MKNTIIMVIILLMNMSLFAQNEPVKVSILHNSNNTRLKNNFHLFFPKNNTRWDAKHFIEMYNQQNRVGKKSPARPVTFMNGPVVFSVTPTVEINRNANTLYQRYSAAGKEPSAALLLLGIAAGITTSAAFPKYSTAPYYPYSESAYQTRYLTNLAEIEAAYLRSTYQQHDK